MDKRQIYETIMSCVGKEVKKALLNESRKTLSERINVTDKDLLDIERRGNDNEKNTGCWGEPEEDMTNDILEDFFNEYVHSVQAYDELPTNTLEDFVRQCNVDNVEQVLKKLEQYGVELSEVPIQQIELHDGNLKIYGKTSNPGQKASDVVKAIRNAHGMHRLVNNDCGYGIGNAPRIMRYGYFYDIYTNIMVALMRNTNKNLITPSPEHALFVGHLEDETYTGYDILAVYYLDKTTIRVAFVFDGLSDIR